MDRSTGRNRNLRNDSGHLAQPILAVEHKHQAEHEDAQHVQGQRDEEEEEEPVVPPADAVVHPRAVVVERLCVVREGESAALGK